MNRKQIRTMAILPFLFFSILASSQLKKINVQGERSFCGFSLKHGFYNKGKFQQYITREAKIGDNSGLADVVQEIQIKLGIDVPITVYIAKDEDNCFATIVENGERIIIADQLFLNRVNKMSGTQWAAISIIAHELGHHIAGFTRRSSQLDSELDADYWSGYILQKLGASQEASVKCIMRFGTEQNTSSHPNKYSRAETIKQGWTDALDGSYDDDRCENCK